MPRKIVDDLILEGHHLETADALPPATAEQLPVDAAGIMASASTCSRPIRTPARAGRRARHVGGDRDAPCLGPAITSASSWSWRAFNTWCAARRP
jgi:hypothetical protein